MSGLLAVVERGKDNLLLVEEYLSGRAAKRTRSRRALRLPPAALSKLGNGPTRGAAAVCALGV